MTTSRAEFCEQARINYREREQDRRHVIQNEIGKIETRIMNLEGAIRGEKNAIQRAVDDLSDGLVGTIGCGAAFVKPRPDDIARNCVDTAVRLANRRAALERRLEPLQRDLNEAKADLIRKKKDLKALEGRMRNTARQLRANNCWPA